MEKMQHFVKYILWIIGFFILSEFLINVGLNSSYKTIERKKDEISQVVMYQAEATKVNGRIKGIINNNEENKINEKYVKLDFYSKRDVNLGSKYIEVDNSKEQIPFEVYFKLNDVSYYTVSLVNEKEKSAEIEFIPKDLNRSDIVIATIIAMLIFW